VNRRATLHPLILIALVNLPIEVILITISDRTIIHYYLTLLPVMAILTGILIYAVPRLLEKFTNSSIQKANQWSPALLLLVVILFQIGQIKYYPEYVRVLAINEYAPVIDYLSQNTEESDKVLIIGAESAVNFLTRREAPTRYVYQYPLALLGRRPMFEEYFNEILQNKPALIIDTRGRTRLDENFTSHCKSVPSSCVRASNTWERTINRLHSLASGLYTDLLKDNFAQAYRALAALLNSEAGSLSNLAQAPNDMPFNS